MGQEKESMSGIKQKVTIFTLIISLLVVCFFSSNISYRYAILKKSYLDLNVISSFMGGGAEGWSNKSKDYANLYISYNTSAIQKEKLSLIGSVICKSVERDEKLKNNFYRLKNQYWGYHNDFNNT